MHAAKQLRMGRLIRRHSDRSLIVPMDHGFTLGPIRGLESRGKPGAWLSHAPIDAVVLHKGWLIQMAEHGDLAGLGTMLHVNGMPSQAATPDVKESVSSVEFAAALGVDGVSLQVNFTADTDRHNWRLLGDVTDKALALGMPVLAMVYDKVQTKSPAKSIERQRRLIRAAAEMGCDFVKIAMPEKDAMRPVLEDLSRDVRILVAGGEAGDEATLLATVNEAINAGAAGVCIGRNVFAHPDPRGMLGRLHMVVHRRVATHRLEVAHAGV